MVLGPVCGSGPAKVHSSCERNVVPGLACCAVQAVMGLAILCCAGVGKRIWIEREVPS